MKKSFHLDMYLQPSILLHAHSYFSPVMQHPKKKEAQAKQCCQAFLWAYIITVIEYSSMRLSTFKKIYSYCRHVQSACHQEGKLFSSHQFREIHFLTLKTC